MVTLSDNMDTMNTVPSPAAADIGISQTAFPDPVQAGTDVTYLLIVVNSGPDPAQDVRITDETSSFLSETHYSMDGGTNWQPWIGTHVAGTLANGASTIMLMRGTVSTAEAGSLINTAAVDSATPDPNPENNQSTTTTTVLALPEPSPADTGKIQRDEAINRIIYSIAMEEAGLSQILNAESDKLRYVIKTLSATDGSSPTIEQVLRVNDSVRQTLQTTLQMQKLLQHKLANALKPHGKKE